MKLTSIQIFNYKSYSQTEPIFVAPKFTVLVGQNNSGKTAFLEALRAHNLITNPHREPARGAAFRVADPVSHVQLRFTVSGEELLHRILSTGATVSLPMAEDANLEKFANSIFAQDTLNFEMNAQPTFWASSKYPSHGLFKEPKTKRSMQISPSRNRQSWSAAGPHVNETDELPSFLSIYYTDALYIFRAERMNVGQCPISNSSELESNAANLASVLLQLPKNASAHELYTSYVREVFPSIYRVVAAPSGPNTAQITVIMNDFHSGDPSPGVEVPLDDSGTGISQVLAILYVVVTAPAPRIIVIDEPNSFLHPGAAKKLLAILKRMPHQYIVTTHSPEIINSADPDILHLVKWDGLATSVETSDRGSLKHQRQILQELDIRLSDVFGADNILWVEGPTEAACFPLLLQYLKLHYAGTAILSLVAPDDLTGRKARSALAWEVYERLSNGSGLLPPALVFSFDREQRTEIQIEDLKRRSKGKARFRRIN